METKSANETFAQAIRHDLVNVEICGLVVQKEMGLLPKEIGREQRIVLDARVGIEPSMIDVPDTLDGLLQGFDLARVRAVMLEEAHKDVNLMETLAKAIAGRVLELEGARNVRIRVVKSYTWADTGAISIEVFQSK